VLVILLTSAVRRATWLDSFRSRTGRPGEFAAAFLRSGTHRFLEFTDDFATWVFFYGPEGGEAAVPAQ
jgi:hypothetical protein